MKQLIIILLLSFSVHAQTYQLLPDTCTFCSYAYTMGGASFYSANYWVDPSNDTIIQANSYKRFYPGNGNWASYIVGVREDSNIVYGFDDNDQSEHIIMNFNANIGDTVFNLYNDGIYYDAEVVSFDSIQLSNGLYHHWKDLAGIRYVDSAGMFTNGWVNSVWHFRWEEMGLCNNDYINGSEPYGGLLFNVPVNEMIIEVFYAFPQYCSADTLYNNASGLTCNTCTLATNGLNVLAPQTKSLLKIIDLMGRETEGRPNTTLIFIYSDGTTEKIYRME